MYKKEKQRLPARILIFIEVDVVVRHFVFSGAFNKLAETFDVTFVYPEKGNKRMQNVDLGKIDLPGDKIRLPIPNARYRVWKWLYLLHQVSAKKGEQSKAIRALHLRNLGPKAALLFSCLALPVVSKLVEWLFRAWLKLNQNHEMVQLLTDRKPNLIIHPCVLEGSYINDLTYYSKALNIPLAVIMNSWDNPSTKRSMVGYPDWLLVWGEQTRRHALEFIGMPEQRVLSFGAAQFDIFRTNPNQSTNQTICQSLSSIPTVL